MSAHPVVLEAFGAEHSLSISEARDLVWRIRLAMARLRVKCSTCRCRIMPDEACPCCADHDLDDEDRFPCVI